MRKVIRKEVGAGGRFDFSGLCLQVATSQPWDRDTYAGGAAAPSALFYGGAGDKRIALHTEHFPSHLACEMVLSGVVDSYVKENLSGGKPQNPTLT